MMLDVIATEAHPLTNSPYAGKTPGARRNHRTSPRKQEPGIAERETLLLAGKKIAFSDSATKAMPVHKQRSSLLFNLLNCASQIPARLDYTAYGVITENPCSPDLLDYYLAFSVSEISDDKDDLITIEVPKATYAFFPHRGEAGLLSNTVNHIYCHWLPASSWRHTGGPDLETYNVTYRSKPVISIAHYAVPIKPE